MEGSTGSDSRESGVWMPWALWSAVFVFSSVSVVGTSWTDAVDAVGSLGLAVGTLAVATIGALIVVRADTKLPGWLLLVFAVLWATTYGLYALIDVLIEEGVIDLGTSQLMIGIAETAVICAFSAILGAFLTVPDGHLPPRLGKGLAIAIAVFQLAWIVQTFFLAGQITDPQTYVNRPALTSLEGADMSPTLEAVTSVMTALGLLVPIATALVMVDRFRSSSREARQQLKWVLVGAMSVLLWWVLWIAQFDGAAGQSLQALVPGLGLACLAAGFGLALFKYRLWDVDIVLRRSLVYGTLWLAIALVYAGVAAGLGLLAGSRFPVSVAIGLTVAATLLFQPARRRLEALADSLVFGHRESPISAIQELGSTVGEARRPDDVAGELADLTRRVLNAQAVEVRIDGSSVAIAGQWANGQETTVSLAWGDEDFGTVRCLPRRGETIEPDDVHVVEALASQAALAISRSRLATRMVTAQESERRRIERDIHDGVQQDLAAQIGQLALARSKVKMDPDLHARLGRIQMEMQRTLSEIRDLAQGIHPSVLRDGGLVAAVEDKVARLRLDVTLEAGNGFRDLRFDEDVEAAAYFTVSEAVANAVKHAEASRISITLSHPGDELVVEVTDDGHGFELGRVTNGSGLSGLSDRLRALGGSLRVESKPGAGTVVRARLPGSHTTGAS